MKTKQLLDDIPLHKRIKDYVGTDGVRTTQVYKMMVLDSQVPEKFQDANLQNDFPSFKKEKSYFIHGKVGTGKTHLMASLLLEQCASAALTDHVVHESNKTLFISVPKLFLDIRKTFGVPGAEYELVDKICSIPYLYFDDLGTERTSDYVVETLYVILDIRYRNQEHICITSNCSLDQIEKKLGDRFASRIYGMCIIKQLKGIDLRKGK